MSIKNQIFSLILLTISTSSFGQSDIALLLSSDKMNKFTLEWRKPVFNKMNFKLGYTMGKESNDYNPTLFDIGVVNDTIIQNFHYSNARRFALKIGLERQIMSSVFYYGIDLFTGFQSRQSNYFQTLRPAETPNENGFFYPIVGQTGSRNDQYISVGGLASLGMNLPISNRFIFNVSVGLGLETERFIKNTQIIDPLNIFNSTLHASMNTYASGTIGLRYKLSKS